jgi:hypothetical protein
VLLVLFGIVFGVRARPAARRQDGRLRNAWSRAVAAASEHAGVSQPADPGWVPAMDNGTGPPPALESLPSEPPTPPTPDLPSRSVPSPDVLSPDAFGDAGALASGRPPVSPAALRLLGIREAPSSRAGGGVGRHAVTLADCQVEAVLAEAPAGKRKGKRTPEGRGWVTSAPYLVWTPLPHDVPAGGIAFACVGAGEHGCLFIDLAAAPGAVTLGGDGQAATRLAESLAYQLCTGSAARRVHVVVVGDVVPAPAAPGVEWLPSIAELNSRAKLDWRKTTELVFCRVNSDEDAFPLARYVGSAPYQVIPVVLADLPGATWSFTAHPSQSPAARSFLTPVVS